jgi:hypothetical protein
MYLYASSSVMGKIATSSGKEIDFFQRPKVVIEATLDLRVEIDFPHNASLMTSFSASSFGSSPDMRP